VLVDVHQDRGGRIHSRVALQSQSRSAHRREWRARSQLKAHYIWWVSASTG
jgi:hypothetical protein